MASFRISQTASVSIETNLSSVNNSSVQLSVDAMSLNSKLSMIPDDIYSFSSEETRLTDLEDEQNEKYPTFTTFNTEIETFINSAMTIDSDVAELINGMKETFYSNHEYLRPESEKPWYQRAWEWCKDHAWEVITLVVVVLLIIGTICLCFIPGINVTVGALLIAGVMNMVVSCVLKGVTDLIVSAIVSLINGKWTWCGGSLTDYFACGVSGFLSGMLKLIPGVNLFADVIGAFVEKFTGNALDNIFCGGEHTLEETFCMALFDAGINLIFSYAGEGLNNVLKTKIPLKNFDDFYENLDFSNLKIADFAEKFGVDSLEGLIGSLPKMFVWDLPIENAKASGSSN